MLVLSRKIKQQIHIGDDIVLTILRLKGDAVQIGIEAPKNVRLLRAEIADRPANPTSLAATSAGSDRRDSARPATARYDTARHDTATHSLDRGDAKRSAVAPRDLSQPPGRQAPARPGRGTTIHGFSAPARAGREVLGESAGLFPFLRERAVHTADRAGAPSCDLGAGQFVL